MGNNTIKKQIQNTIHKGKADKLIYILKKYPQFVNKQLNEDNQHTPLISAVWNQNYIITRILIADLNCDVNKFGGTMSPLIAAAIKDDTNIIELLIQFKANIKYQNSQGLNAIDFAILYGSYRAAHLLNVKYSMKIGVDIKKYQNLSYRYSINHVNYQKLMNHLVNGSSSNFIPSAIFKKQTQIMDKTKVIPIGKKLKTQNRYQNEEIQDQNNQNNKMKFIDKKEQDDITMQLRKDKLTEKTQDESPMSSQVQY